jgi:hypothetical protein
MEFKLRASAAGKLMTNPRKKGEVLSETTKTYLQDWTKEQIYGVKHVITSKYLTKGIEVENDSIAFAEKVLGWNFAVKNEESYDDDFFTGTPDVIFPREKVVDIKSSWDCFTFPLFADEVPNKDYFYQLQVYMHLTGLKEAELVYVLMETPEDLTHVHYDYSEVKPEHRVKVFPIQYDEEVIDQLHTRIIDSRNYINQLLKTI